MPESKNEDCSSSSHSVLKKIKSAKFHLVFSEETLKMWDKNHAVAPFALTFASHTSKE